MEYRLRDWLLLDRAGFIPTDVTSNSNASKTTQQDGYKTSRPLIFSTSGEGVSSDYYMHTNML